ncbi:hypothetical protein [Castellaniella sp. MT123]|uniref:hypothetical protein n=1 Tax=Castellaniella sp. MT123 TaxID=3140381 RepID=UPI0031F41A30
MKSKRDTDHIVLAGLLDELLASNVTITVREVARRHAFLRTASAFTRNTERMALIEQAQSRQLQLRNNLNPFVAKAASLSDKLGRQAERVSELEEQVKALIVSHAACVRAVATSGGMPALTRFWAEYKKIGDVLENVSAFPQRAEVVSLPLKKKDEGR